MNEEQEKKFRKVWNRYKSILIEEREARKIFECGVMIGLKRHEEYLTKQGKVFDDPAVKKLMGWK